MCLKQNVRHIHTYYREHKELQEDIDKRKELSKKKVIS